MQNIFNFFSVICFGRDLLQSRMKDSNNGKKNEFSQVTGAKAKCLSLSHYILHFLIHTLSRLVLHSHTHSIAFFLSPLISCKHSHNLSHFFYILLFLSLSLSHTHTHTYTLFLLSFSHTHTHTNTQIFMLTHLQR